MSDNPFLLPPGGAKPKPASPTVPDAAPAPAPASDPSHYIAIPASVESATHRIARPTQQATPEPLEETRLAPPVLPATLALVLPDGSSLRLEGPLLLGRDPAGIPERPDARPVAVSDPGKTVSKTHALIEPDPAGRGVRVHDLFSTNGVAVDAAGIRTTVSPGGSVQTGVGSSILLGSFVIGVASGDRHHA